MNHVDQLVRDWGWWNRAYTRLLLRARGCRLVSMAKTLPEVASISDLTRHEHGAIFRLEPRQSLHDFQPPRIALGEHAAYVVDSYKREFEPRQDRPFIAYFKNPVLYGRQFSILEPGRVFEECFIRDRRWREGVPKRSQKLSPKKVPGTFLLAGTEFHNHFAHLFCDVLPHWKLFEEAGLAGQFPALLPPPSHTFAAEAWNMLGLIGNGSLEWDDGCWQMDGLYFASSFKKFCSWTPEAATWTRHRLIPEIAQRPPGKKALYISRTGTVARSMLNEDEIIRALEPYGVTVVHPEKLPLRQQMELFADAGLIIGPHGAGIQNALWAPRGCRILELVNAHYFSGVYWTLAESIGNPYGLVAGISSGGKDPTQDGYTCDPRLVREAVDRLTTTE